MINGKQMQTIPYTNTHTYCSKIACFSMFSVLQTEMGIWMVYFCYVSWEKKKEWNTNPINYCVGNCIFWMELWCWYIWLDSAFIDKIKEYIYFIFKDYNSKLEHILSSRARANPNVIWFVLRKIRLSPYTVKWNWIELIVDDLSK